MDSIKDKIHYYIGCKLSNGQIFEPHLLLYGNKEKFENGFFKLALRRLSSITEEEAIELARCVVHHTEFVDIKTYRDRFGDLIVESKHDLFNATGEKTWSAEQFHYLLSRGFWLWSDEAFDKGLIIEKK